MGNISVPLSGVHVTVVSDACSVQNRPTSFCTFKQFKMTRLLSLTSLWSRGQPEAMTRTCEKVTCGVMLALNHTNSRRTHNTSCYSGFVAFGKLILYRQYNSYVILS